MNFVQDYWLDAWQRSILFLDVMRERGNIIEEHNAKEVPHVLHFQAEVLRDGRKLERPVNYALVRIVPPAGTKIDPEKAPIVVVDPRAGHGPGIGGMKHDSQIGVALAAGHACCFIRVSSQSDARANDRGRLPRREPSSSRTWRRAIQMRKANQSSSATVRRVGKSC